MLRNFIIILFALFLVACNNDGNDSSSQSLFLEKYDGVVWEQTDNDPDPLYRFGFVFYSNPQSWGIYEFYNNDGDCVVKTFGTEYQDGTIATVNSSTEDELVLEVTGWTDYDDGIVLDTYLLSITAVNNGENLVVEYSNDPTGDEFFERIFGDPCN